MYKSFPDGNGGFVIYQVDDAGNKIGSPLGETHPSKLLADLAVRDLINSSDLLIVDADNSFGNTILAVAATNEPFIGLKDHPSEIIQFDGTDYVRVPMLMQGYYMHPWYGPLIYNQPAFDEIIRNHVMGVAEAPVYYRVNHRDNAAVAFFDLDRGGWLAEEEVKGDKLLVGYGPIVDQQRAVDTVRDYVCASADIDPSYIPFRIQKFARQKKSSVHVYSINASWNYSRTRFKEAKFMKKQKVTIAGVTIEIEVGENGFIFDDTAMEQLQAITLPDPPEDLQPQVDQLTQDLTAAREQVQTLEARVKELGGTQEPEMSEAARQRFEALERRAQEAERREYESAIKQVVSLARNYRDDKGNGHSQVFINWIDAVLNSKPVGQGADVVKLTAQDVAGYRRYMLEATMWLSGNLPPVVHFNSQTGSENDDNPLAGDAGQEAELAAVAKKGVLSYTKRHGGFAKQNGTEGGAK